jgi:GNAT superfamily N-acetyltransferase
MSRSTSSRQTAGSGDTVPPFSFAPVTPDRWPDVERLFGARGACGGCWCMTWRLTAAAFERGKGAPNREALRRLVGKEPPGILAYEDEAPVGWCAVAPRAVYVRLERSRVLRPIDAEPVWSISCLFVARSHRRRGLSVALLRAASAHAGTRGARIVEGYPVIPSTKSLPDAFAWTGTLSAFRAAGFREVARGSPSRPIMRLTTG